MSFSFLTTALLIVSILNGLTVEGIKKMLDGTNIKYSSNILAVITSIILSVGVSLVYIAFNEIPFTEFVGIEIGVLVFLGFLVSTVGYDKVIQTIRQFQEVKEVPHE